MTKTCISCSKFLSCPPSIQEWKKIKAEHPYEGEKDIRVFHMETFFARCKEKAVTEGIL